MEDGIYMPKKKEGKPIGNKVEDKPWREWFDKLSLEDHDKYLEKLGLDNEDIEEFNEDFGEKKEEKVEKEKSKKKN